MARRIVACNLRSWGLLAGPAAGYAVFYVFLFVKVTCVRRVTFRAIVFGLGGVFSYLCLFGKLSICVSEGRGRGGGHRHSRGERGCLAERCRVPQEGYTPLHVAALGGHAAVVELLWAAGADTETKMLVSRKGRF